MLKLKGILLAIAQVKKIDSKYSLIAKLFSIENQKIYQLYFPKEHCTDSLFAKLNELKGKEVEIEVDLPYNLIVANIIAPKVEDISVPKKIIMKRR